MAAEPLLIKACITESYVTAMINIVKEYGAYIVVGKGVALVHARPEQGVKKPGLTVMTLRQPVNFGNPENDPVKLVFCLAAADSNAHLEIIKDMVHIIDKEEKIALLVKQTSVVDFRQSLQQIERGDLDEKEDCSHYKRRGC